MTTAITKTADNNAIMAMAESLKIDSDHMVRVIKAHCFKGHNPNGITNEQLAAYIAVAESLRKQAPEFNPLLSGFLYAYPSKGGGIEPIIGPDGVFCLLNNNPNIEHFKTDIELDDKGNPVAAIAYIWTKGKKHPYEKKVLMSEWKVDSNPNWKQRPSHMLEIRALKQCARMVMHGIPLDRDENDIKNAVEAEVISERKQISTADALKAHFGDKPAIHSDDVPSKDAPEAIYLDPPTLEPEEKAEVEASQEEQPKVPEHGGDAHFEGFSRDDCPFAQRGMKGKVWLKEFDEAQAASEKVPEGEATFLDELEKNGGR